MHIGLLSCGKKKQDSRCKACDMYTSGLFKLGLEYLVLTCPQVYILSSKYGLLGLNEVIEPYEETLKNKTREQRILWGSKVAEQLLKLPERITLIRWCAGVEYQKPLRPYLEGNGITHVNPLVGLSLGYRMQYLKQEIELLRNRQERPKFPLRKIK